LDFERIKHSRAYQALAGDAGEHMARILKMGAKAEDSPKCLACHALYNKAGAARPQISKSPKVFPAKIGHGLRGLVSTPQPLANEKSVQLGMAETRKRNSSHEKMFGVPPRYQRKIRRPRNESLAGHPTFILKLDFLFRCHAAALEAPSNPSPETMEDPAWRRPRLERRPGRTTPRRDGAPRLASEAALRQKKMSGPSTPSFPASPATIRSGPAATLATKARIQRTQTWRSHVETLRASPSFRLMAEQWTVISAGIERVERGVGEMSKLNPDRKRRRSAATALPQSRSDSLTVWRACNTIPRWLYA